MQKGKESTLARGITCYCRIMMPLRDGVKLATDVYLPAGGGRYPVIVIRTPYGGCATRAEDAPAFARQGLGIVIQDCRGTGQSEGEADLWRQERNDAEDLFNWMSAQPWFDGNLVTNGESYPGATQWQAARLGHPAMKGLTPHNAPLDIYEAGYYNGGAYGYSVGVFWAFGMLARRRKTEIKTPWRELCDLLPLRRLDTLLGFEPWPLWRQWMDHPSRDAFWQSADSFADVGKMTAPAYITGGWFDIFIQQTLRGFAALRQSGGSEAARRFTRCCIEPLDHDMRTADIDYGPDHHNNIIAIRNRFMRNIVTRPDQDPLPDQPVMRFFVMGSNHWAETNAWPLPETRHTPLYLHADGAANSTLGRGRLAFEPPANDLPADTFIYNPLDPVPTLGGNNLGHAGTPPGQREQASIERRGDVLVYTSEPLDRDLNIIGPVRALLHASSTALDTDFTVKLCDVYPDGKSYNVCDGLLRARYRDGSEAPSLIEPGRVYAFDIDCWVTAMTFLKGHRLRVQVSSSNFPRFDRNPNTGAAFGADARLLTARQLVYHDATHPSHLLLPMIPRASPHHWQTRL
jgi:uncharacterized protein